MKTMNAYRLKTKVKFFLMRAVVPLFILNFLSQVALGESDNNDTSWAREHLQKISKLQEGSDNAEATSFAEHLKKNMAKTQTDENKRWAEKQVMKSHRVAADMTQANTPTKNGINIDKLIAKYSNHMPTAQTLMHGKYHDLLIFVSFSMPQQSLKAWLNQSRAAGGILVIRGLVDNSFKKTAAKVQKLIGKTGGGLEVDPTLFRRFHIKKVPAVVVVNGHAPPCFNVSGCPFDTPPYDVIYGNVTLQRALMEIGNKGKASQQKANLILTHMRATS